jgi:hydrogenase maturation protein HypF
MRVLHYPFITAKKILALGAESSGNFAVYKNGWIYFSDDFGDLLEAKNYSKYRKNLLVFLKKNGIKPDMILCDLHPNFKTTILAKQLAKKYKAESIQVQHQIAHVFSAFGEDEIRDNKNYKDFIGIAMDGTGFGTDGKIWGGEAFKIENNKITRIGHLEDQVLIGGDLAVKEPARVLISIFSKFLTQEKIYPYVKKFYRQKEFELLFNQLKTNFNCIQSSSSGRVLDAVSVLLGFSKNERNYKHEATLQLDKNSSIPFEDLKVAVSNNLILTTPLFQYLINNSKRDKKRLAATAQMYLAQGLAKIAQTNSNQLPVYFAGGITENKIISNYFNLQNFTGNQELPKGDPAISFGQLIYYLNL